jgi:hypothetical protein
LSDHQRETAQQRRARYLRLAAEAEQEADRTTDIQAEIYLRSIAVSWQKLAENVKG